HQPFLDEPLLRPLPSAAPPRRLLEGSPLRHHPTGPLMANPGRKTPSSRVRTQVRRAGAICGLVSRLALSPVDAKATAAIRRVLVFRCLHHPSGQVERAISPIKTAQYLKRA